MSADGLQILNNSDDIMNDLYREDDYVAVHDEPAWRDKSDFIVRAFLGKKNGRNEWEQLWVARSDELIFVICCIPFFVFDLALGDKIETNEYFTLLRVVSPSDNYTFRVWFGDSPSRIIREEVAQYVKKHLLVSEQSSENMIAISAGGVFQAQALANYLHDEQQAGRLMYETGRTR
jgi:Domain of unknown function (DUF4265)